MEGIEKYDLEIEVINLGKIIIELERTKEPITIGRIIKKLPLNISGRFYFGGRDYFMIPIGIKKSVERKTSEVHKGEVLYDASSDSLVISLKDGESPFSLISIGRVTKGIENFEKIAKRAPLNIKLMG